MEEKIWKIGRPEKAAPNDFGRSVKVWEQKKLTCNMNEATFYHRVAIGIKSGKILQKFIKIPSKFRKKAI